MGQMVR